MRGESQATRCCSCTFFLWYNISIALYRVYESLTERYKGLEKRYTTLTKQRAHKEYNVDVLSGFLFELSELDLLDTEWKDSRFRATVESITVHNDGRLVFTFTNGSEETVMM